MKTRQSNFQTYLMLQCSVKCVMLCVSQYCIDRPVSDLLSLGWSGTSGLKQNRGLQSWGCPIARSPNSGERAIGRPVADAPKLWPKDTSRTTELVLQCLVHQKNQPHEPILRPLRGAKKTARLNSGTPKRRVPGSGRNPGVPGPRRSRGVLGPSSVGNRAKNSIQSTPSM